MKIMYTHSPKDIRNYSTSELRDEFLADEIFTPGAINSYYTYNDRMIFGGVMPLDKTLEIVMDKELGVEYFLQRRELGVINIGGPGKIVIDGKEEDMVKQDGYYVGIETKELKFKSLDKNNPAKFYFASTPGHKKHPNVKISISQIVPRDIGEQSTMNKRKIYQYVHPNNCESCQLQMGYTILNEGSGWNTMPVHTHARRMETYFYFDMDEDSIVFHFMGLPDETKHIVMQNEQAVTSPSWSIHSGIGTKAYSFIWAMCGENITYDDMDHVVMKDIK